MNQSRLHLSVLLSIFQFVFGQNVVTKSQNETSQTHQTSMTGIERLFNQTECCSTYEYDHDHDHDHDHCCVQRNEKFARVRTLYNGDIYMIYKCPANYTSLEIIRNCETTDEVDLLHNVLLSIPVTNETKNITYKNVFCAFCHDESQFELWNVTMSCRLMNEKSVEIIPEGFHAENLQTISHQLLLSNLKVDESRQVLISKIGVSTYKCEINAKLPRHLDTRTSAAARCCCCNASTVSISDRTYSDLSAKQQQQQLLSLEPTFPFAANTTLRNSSKTFQVHLNDTFLSRINRCDHIPSDSAIRKTICPPSDEKAAPALVVNSAEQDAEFCFYKTVNGRRCLINGFLTKDADFRYVDNDTIFVKRFEAKFGVEEWIADTPDGSTIFLCGTEIPRSDGKKFNDQMNAAISGILIKASIVFLAAHLLLSTDGSKLQSLPNKITYSYSLVLIAIYVLWEMQSWLASCMVASIVMHYLCLSCFAWLLIASYDCWLIVCHSSEKFLTFAGKSRIKRYLAYCFWGWISPLPIIATATYFEFAPISKIPCSLKPGYGRLNQCFLAQETPLNYFYQYPTAAVTFLNVSLFVHTSYRIFVSKRKGITSTAQNNSYIIFIKLSFNMGVVALMVLVWAFYILVTNTDFVVFQTMKHIFEASQGIFIFFAFSFDKNMIKMNI